MPEGPEIIITQQYLTTKCLKKNIVQIDILSGRYTHQDINGWDELQLPVRIKKIFSKGKLLWFELTDQENNNLVLFCTFGLTGEWGFTRSNSSRIRFVLESTNKKKYSLYFADQRNFGTIEFIRDPEKIEQRINRLAPDILRTQMDDNTLIQIFKDYMKAKPKKAENNLVKLLMDDQTAIVSGIGNYLIAEILYDAKLSPHRKLSSLDGRELRRLAHSIRLIAKTAYGNNTTGYMSLFPSFLKTHADRVKTGKISFNFHPDIKLNDSFQFKVYGQDTDPHGNPVHRDEIIKSRTLYWVPRVQK